VKREDVLQQAVLPEHGLQATAEQIEKRRHTRFPVSVSAEVIETKTRARVTGRASDLGVGGCYIDTLSTFAEGTQVEVLLHWEGRTLHCHALVTYAVTGRSIGMGLAFTGTAMGQESTLLDWMRGLGGDPRAGSQEKAEPETTAEPEPELAKPAGLKGVVQELIDLLAEKRLLTDSEAARLRNELSE
jgi:hypothetical protein